MASAHPALVSPAGLTSGSQHVATNRWDPVKESSDYSERFGERRVKSQVALPVPHLTAAYTNDDIPFSHPTNRPLLACTGLPRNFKIGSRCVNPLEPRYILPGCSPATSQGGAVPSPNASGGGAPAPWATASSEPPGGTAGSLRRPGSERLLVPAMSVPRSTDTPKLQPLPSPSGSAPSSQQLQQQQPYLAANSATLNTNGAVGGLLLYGPTATPPHATASGGAATAATTSAGGAAAVTSGAGVGVPVNRSLDVTDINGQRRSSSVPPRRNGGFDPLHVADIVPPRRPSPSRPLACLTTTDILGAAPKHRTRDVPSPGRGTLTSADISGASPGCLTRASPTTYALGRWPAPAVPQHQFAHSTRVTMLKKPISIGD